MYYFVGHHQQKIVAGARALHKTPTAGARGAGFSSHACAFIINLSVNPFVTEHPASTGFGGVYSYGRAVGADLETAQPCF